MLSDWYFNGVLYPLPEMRRDDADLVLKLVAKNRITYDNPVNDPIFSAHTKFTTVDETDGSNVTLYYSDFPASVIGCTQQVSYCLILLASLTVFSINFAYQMAVAPA